MKELFLEYKYPIIGGLIGLVLALFFFTIGFFKTILLLVMVGIGVFIGSYKNEDLFGKIFQNK